MANTKIPSELSSTPSISDSVTLGAITIDSNNKVGVGIGSPLAIVHVDGGTTDYDPSSTGTGLFHVTGGASSKYTAYIGVSDSGVSIGHNGGGTRYLRFDTNETERMRITSNGELLVGTTTESSSNSIQMSLVNSSGNSGIQFFDDNTDTGGAIINSGGALRFFTATGAQGSESYTFQTAITTTGVGIKTESPSKALVVNDTTEVDGIQLRLQGDSTRGGTMEFRRGDSFTWRVGCGGASSTNSAIPASFFGIEDGGDNLAFCIAHTTYRVGIGLNNPSNKFHIKGSSGEYVYRHENGNGNFKMSHGNSSFHHFYQNGASTGFYFGSACQANGGFSTYSDERLKENITTIDGALDKVALMNGVSFTWIDTEKRGEGKQFGVTAQNMLEVDAELPKLVEDADATNEEIANEDIDTQYYSMDYSRLTPFFIEAIKELKTKLEAAEARITELEG